MKKYKLIKTYPGSFALGYILSPLNSTINPIYYNNGMFFNPEKYPEHWEEVPEKDYEILSLYQDSINSGDIYFLSELTEKQKQFFLKGLNKKDCDQFIHSVKRLSDGEVFTVGDIVELNYTGIGGYIKKFTIKNNQILFDFDHVTSFNANSINVISKIKKPLFTTEDGVDIFEGDKIFSVNRTNFQHYDSNRVITNNFSKSSVYKYFSTKEKAEEYILMNKPCLSVNDVKTLLPSTNYTCNILLKLKGLVKSKL